MKKPKKLKKVTNLKKYFIALAEELDKLFPKGKCKERGAALMLNAWANIYAEKLIEAEREREVRRFADYVWEGWRIGGGDEPV